MEFFAEGSPTTTIDDSRAAGLLEAMLARWGPIRRALLIPPDFTRAHSHAGALTSMLYHRLASDAEVAILPALGTHAPMTDDQITRMFPDAPHDRFRDHDWRDDVVEIGVAPAELIADLSEGKVRYPISFAINRLLLEEPWDAIISVGQVVPHEVVGIANHAKNIFVGVGGADAIHKSHFLGAAFGMERMMGRWDTPVRRLLDYAAHQFAKSLPLRYVLTVRGLTADGELVTRGMYAGDDEACFLKAAALCQQVNLDVLDREPQRVVVYLDPSEYHSTWLGNKAIYRTRMAIADAGELIVLAPGVCAFGEDATIDRLIRKHGYRGTPATLAAVDADPDVADNLSAAAHLIHGSTEGRFRVVYAAGGLTEKEIEGVGYEFADLQEMLDRFEPTHLKPGWNREATGAEFFFISNPGLGLWGTRERFGELAS